MNVNCRDRELTLTGSIGIAMSQSGVNPYLKTKVMTASPEELRLMLYEGAIRFCRQASMAIEKKDFETSYNNLMKAQKIVLELSTSLKHDVAPELCEKLAALYTYIYRRLVDANINRDTAAIDEAIELIDYEKQTWELLMQKMHSGANKTAAADVLGARQTAMSSLSTQG